MEPSSRHVLLTALLAGLLVSAGCTATFDGGGTAADTPTPAPMPTVTPSTTPTPTPGECEAVGQAVVDPFRDDVEPRDLPDPPVAWNRSSVERYVVAFEEAWAYNEALEVATESVSVIVGDVSVERRGDAWVVELTSRTNTWVQGRVTGTATATVVHADGAPIPVTYRLTDRALHRTEGRIGGTPSGTAAMTPERGRLVACLDG